MHSLSACRKHGWEIAENILRVLSLTAGGVPELKGIRVILSMLS